MCAALNTPFSMTIADKFKQQSSYAILTETSPFEMEYRILYLQLVSPYILDLNTKVQKIWHLGLCVPKACSNADLKIITDAYFSSKMLKDQQIFKLQPKVERIKNLQLSEEFFKRPSLLICLLIFGSVVVLHFWSYCKVGFRKNTNNEIKYLRSSAVLQCFNLEQNFKHLFSLEQTSHNQMDIAFINGLKTISTVFVVLFHIPIFQPEVVTNSVYGLYLNEWLCLRLVPLSVIIVELFFVLE